MDSSGDMRQVMKTLFNTESFKNSINKPKVKSPTELVVGVIKQTGEFKEPTPGIHEFAVTSLNGSPFEGPLAIMGQRLMNPPTVEGWHSGREWIDSGTLVERVNFTAGEMGRVEAPGIQAIINRLGDEGSTVSTESLVDGCLEMLGGYGLMPDTRTLLLSQFQNASALEPGTEEFAHSIGQMLQLIVSTQEYQFT